MSAETTTCPECAGLGRVMDRGALVSCDECDGAGRVPAVWMVDYSAAFLFGDHPANVLPPEFLSRELVAVPKEARS